MAEYRLSNDFHNSETSIRVLIGDRLTRDRVRRIKRRLCGVSGCTCGDELGTRGRQPDNGNLVLINSGSWKEPYEIAKV